MQVLPNKASRYIQEQFKNAHISHVEKTDDPNGLYRVYINQNEITYKLEFSEFGDLIAYKNRPIFMADQFECDY